MSNNHNKHNKIKNPKYFSLNELYNITHIPYDFPLKEQYLTYDLSTDTPYTDTTYPNINQLNQMKIEEKALIKVFLNKRTTTSKDEPQSKPSTNTKQQHSTKTSTDRVHYHRPPPSLSLNLTYSNSPSTFLSSPFHLQTQTNTITCYLYPITFPNKTFYAVLMPVEIICDFPLKLIDHHTHQIEQFVILSGINLVLTVNEFQDLVLYHMKLLYDCFLKCELTETEYHKGYERLFNQTSVEKKYIIVPIEENSLTGMNDINWNKVNHCKNVFHNNKVESLEDMINTFNDNNNNTVHNDISVFESDSYTKSYSITNPPQDIQSKLNYQLLKPNLFYTKYRIWNIYNIFNCLYADEPYETFLRKISCNNKSYAEHLTNKYFSTINQHTSSNTHYIMSEYTTKASSITGYRLLSDKYNITINANPICYSYGKKMQFVFESYLYYNTILTETKKETLTTDDKKEMVHSIFPIDTLYKCYFDKSELDIISKLPSILTYFESILIPYQFITDNVKLQIDNNTFSYDNGFKYFLYALTTPTSLQDYNYETLETLGDSILKIIITILIYLNDNILHLNQTAGDLEKKRAFFISNKHLFQKGKAYSIYKYILSRKMDIKHFSFPLKVMSDIEEQIDITEKTMADVIEAVIGAIFLFRKRLSDAMSFIIRCNIVNNVPTVDDVNEMKVDSWASSITHQDVFDTTLKSITIDDSTLYEMLPNIQIVDYDILILDLLSLYGVEYVNDSYINTIDDLENKILNYTFKNKQLLLTALTHKTFNRNCNENYEKMELLGDSIVEAFVSSAMFNIYSNYLYSSSYDTQYHITVNDIESIKRVNGQMFNNNYMTQIKSLLCSNVFMCKLNAFLHLYKFIQVKTSSLINEVNAFSSQRNINKILNKKMSDYNDPDAVNPKIMADLFEAVVGAIYLDSNLEQCYKFVSRIYNPFIIYCAQYFNKLKYSITNDFILLTEDLLKTVPEFIESKTTATNENEYQVEIRLHGDYLCTGKGASYELAKQDASSIGLKYIKEQYVYTNNNNNNHNNNIN